MRTPKPRSKASPPSDPLLLRGKSKRSDANVQRACSISTRVQTGPCGCGDCISWCLRLRGLWWNHCCRARGYLPEKGEKKGLSLFAYGGRARRHYDDVVEGPSPASAGGRPLSPPHSGQVGGWYVGIVPTQLHYTGEMMEMRPPSPTHHGEQQAPNAKPPSHPQLLLAATALLLEYLFPIFASQAPKIHDKRNPPTLLHYPSP